MNPIISILQLTFQITWSLEITNRNEIWNFKGVYSFSKNDEKGRDDKYFIVTMVSEAASRETEIVFHLSVACLKVVEFF